MNRVRGLDPDLLIATSSKELSIHSIHDFSKTNAFSIDGEVLNGIDSQHNQFCTFKGGQSFIRHLTTGEVLYTLPFTNYSGYLYGNKLIDYDGLIYFINN